LYQFIHAILLFGIALLILFLFGRGVEIGLLKWAGYLAIAGVFIFSGSLYALCLSGIKWLGAITPIGGVLFIISWFLVALSAMRLMR
jgi:uncharacterized membrane protein YgdD (TMEM256/DUF423 family)